ncbi:MAG: aminodeoxychorismate synthase component I [Gemmataceae bacterium]|nr:aminodeoxychorismate synthase component I [Gemmataceae bacterium]
MFPEPLASELKPAPAPGFVAQRLSGLPNLIWFDSGQGFAELGRYSYLAAAPAEWYCGRVDHGRSPWSVLPDVLKRFRLSAVAGLPPFQGGIAGLFGYGLNRSLERVPAHRIDEFQLPDFALGVYPWVMAWDHLTDRAWIVATGWPEVDEPSRRRRAEKQIDDVQTWLRRGCERPSRPHQAAVSPTGLHPVPSLPGISSNFDRPGFEAAVSRAVAYTHAGDCFQVNLAQRLLTPLTEPAFGLYCRLRQVNPAPFAAFFDAGEFQLLSASPERFLQLAADGQVETRPIKGTRPRGITPEHDALLGGALQESVKDRAENVMIVDLLRNDLGRVCEFGSVRVDVVCGLESYATVHHLVSQIRGRLRSDQGPLDLLKAAFPGGSVTGAPKVRAMQIIAELEPHARGAYCGCLGWIGFNGAMDTNILIRTFTAAKGWLQFPVGGGIVADSDPAREYEETLYKAAGLVRLWTEP